MAPIWHKGLRNYILQASISFTAGDRNGQTEGDRNDETGWKMLNAQWEEFAVLPRDEKVEGGAIVWGWNPDNKPFYRTPDGWVPFDQFNRVDVASLDVAFFGDSEPPRSENPDSSPVSWDGIHVLLALEKGTNALHLKYFAPEKRLEYDALPKNEATKFDLPRSLSAPSKELAIRQARLRPRPASVEAYLLGKGYPVAIATTLSEQDRPDQVYHVDKDGLREFGPHFGGDPVSRIYVNADAVWAMGGKKIWRRTHDGRTRGGSSWETPSWAKWQYLDIHPGDDGLLLAVVGDVYFGYTPEDGWRRQKQDRSFFVQMARLPLGGFRLFSAAWDASKTWEAMERAPKRRIAD